MPKKGDIVLIHFPFTDYSGEKLRPALLMGMSDNHVIALFITSRVTLHKKWSVPIDATEKTGLRVKSAIQCDKLASFDSRIVQGCIGTVPKVTLKQVDANIKELLKLQY